MVRRVGLDRESFGSFREEFGFDIRVVGRFLSKGLF